MEYTYQVIETGIDKIIVRSDGACIPFAESNSDYQKYLEDTKDGWTEPVLTK